MEVKEPLLFATLIVVTVVRMQLRAVAGDCFDKHFRCFESIDTSHLHANFLAMKQLTIKACSCRQMGFQCLLFPWRCSETKCS